MNASNASNATTSTRPIRVATVRSGRPEDNGRRVRLALFRDFCDTYRWYGANPGDAPRRCREMDTEVSGGTVASACEAARRAWAGAGWDLRTRW